MQHEHRLLIAAVVSHPWIQIYFSRFECELLVHIIICRDDLIHLISQNTSDIQYSIVLIRCAKKKQVARPGCFVTEIDRFMIELVKRMPPPILEIFVGMLIITYHLDA